MAKQNLDKKVAESKEAAESILDAMQNIADALGDAISNAADGLNDMASGADIIGKTMKRGIVAELKQSVKNQEEIIKLQAAAAKGEAKASDVAKTRKKLQDNRALTEAKLNNLSKYKNTLGDEEYQKQQRLIQDHLDYLGQQEEELENINTINDGFIIQGGLLKAIGKNIKEYVTGLDKSGIAAALMNDEISGFEKASVAGEAAIMALAKGALQASSNAANLAKETGISSKSSYALQRDFANVAINTEKAFINSVGLNESFTSLVKQTGLLSTFSGDTLVTMTTLTKQLGLGVKEASQLSLLARIQGEDTEGILDSTVETVNAINRQRKSAISAKAVLNDVASASASIAVSLGMNPQLLAEAATEARALGLNLEDVDKIAGSLLNFEKSIEDELKFQMLTGKEINLDKARQLALDNDLAGLSEEIANNSGITEAFATGNRIQQQAAADALGMSRDELGQMVMQQELLNLSQDDFIAKYGEQSYQQMQSQSAAEKFQSAMEKIQSIIGDMALSFAPILDMLAGLADNAFLAYTAMALIAGLSLAKTIMSMATMAATLSTSAVSGITLSSALTIGLGTAAVLAAVVGIVAAMNSQKKQAQSVKDGIADSSRGPFTITDAYGAMATTADGDSLQASPNIGKGGDGRILAVLERIANKDSNVYMDSQAVGSTLAVSTNRI
jgi:DNA-binding phage protein